MLDQQCATRAGHGMGWHEGQMGCELCMNIIFEIAPELGRLACMSSLPFITQKW